MATKALKSGGHRFRAETSVEHTGAGSPSGAGAGEVPAGTEACQEELKTSEECEYPVRSLVELSPDALFVQQDEKVGVH